MMNLFRKFFYFGLDKLFDVSYGIETCKNVPLEALPSPSAINLSSLRQYQGTPTLMTLRLFSYLRDFPFWNYEFIDVGCGKGRVLVHATQKPFKRVHGIEVFESLAKICQSNVSQKKVQHFSQSQVTIHHQNALDFRPLDNPCVYFFLTPLTAGC